MRRSRWTAFQGFIDTLRARCGSHAVIVVSATYVYGTTALADAAQRVVAERNARGDDRVIADRLLEFVATLPLRW
ncbi:hypothetical protein GCM10009557_72380 [Virgisporangium ochraceum]|uniref:Uncharacterized protein n=1 Tax=Virgisporangium ochraceum TaxID=65505 RepID=A0A8J4A2V2_9ACTN|nr:hypothetical protein [Virgisporangium ochraceum]GIJ73537.1 hypothetical protein Voc01_084540 [Virgisporangium ochraceum]